MRREACPRCGTREYIKAGLQPSGKQRFQCKVCRKVFVETLTQRYPQEKRELARKLYLEGLGFRAIGRIIEVSNVTVLNWIREMGRCF
jgi:transposase-like protein